MATSNSFNCPDDFRIEISGWGLDNSFLVERTDLLWTSDGEKHVQMHRALPEGAVVFIRLLASEPSNGSVPVAYRGSRRCADGLQWAMPDEIGATRPKSKESPAWKNASNVSEDSERVCDVREFGNVLQHEEILQ